MFKMLFWNNQQRRLRAFWRLVFQFGLMLVLFLLASLPPFRGIDELSKNTIPLGMAMLGSVWLAGRFLDRRRFADFGFHFSRDWWIDLGFGLALGSGLMAAIFFVQLAAGSIAVTGAWQVSSPELTFGAAMVYMLFDCICVGIYEELFSRGYQLGNLAEGLSGALGSRGAVIVSVLLSSTVFGVLHLLNDHASALSAFNISVAGIMLAMGYVLTGELAIPIGVHIAWNFFQGNVFGFPASGFQPSVSVITVQPVGSPLLTGGDFGPEAGLVGLGVCILGIVLTIVWVRVRYGTVRIRRELAEVTGAVSRQKVRLGMGTASR
jgi:membrane protease YdiL (CAAX protease family)